MAQSNYMWFKVNEACLVLFIDTERIHNTISTAACFLLAKNLEEESLRTSESQYKQSVVHGLIITYVMPRDWLLLGPISVVCSHNQT